MKIKRMQSIEVIIIFKFTSFMLKMTVTLFRQWSVSRLEWKGNVTGNSQVLICKCEIVKLPMSVSH